MLLVFIIAMTPLNQILSNFTAGYKLSRSQEKFNHLMYMDEIKLFAKKWRTRKLLETKLNSRNLSKVINTWAVPLVRYSGPFFKWTRDEQMNQRIRKLMTMH